ncbi:MAG: NAD-dependent epimerase [Balneolaceae bacterium]|nr:NAD-dependent epimerase [Balneolaceae bacterium]
MPDKHILVTGAAGFIGFHLSRRLVEEGYRVTGLDNINDYYSPQLKKDRLKELGIAHDAIREKETVSSESHDSFQFIKADLEDQETLNALFEEENFDVIVHLAAQAGVRYSLEHPHAYIDSNITGFLNVLEAARHHPVEHLIFASSSSVYGANTKVPFSVEDNVDHPVSLYAATKKSNELMAHTYASLYDIPVTGLRFFTVYGPWGRPDMAYFLFTDAIVNDRPIKVFNHGDMERDFTYIDDITESITRLIPMKPEPDESWSGKDPHPARSFAPYRLFNIGNSSPVDLMDFIGCIEQELGKEAEKNMLPMQPGDVARTWADVESLIDYIGYRPEINIEEGIRKFVEWYLSYYRVQP